MIKLILNAKMVTTTMQPGEVTLDFIRKQQGLKGTKEGCREGDCGACSVLIGELTDKGIQYRSVASCLFPVGQLHGKHLVTIEGLNGATLSPIQQAIVDEGATQCGFCTPGIIISLTGFLLNSPTLSTEDAFSAIEGNICRCTGYTAISRAVEKLTANLKTQQANINARIENMVASGILPNIFLGIKEQLANIQPYKQTTPADATTIIGGGTDIYVQQPDNMLDIQPHFISRNPNQPAVTTDEHNQIIVDAAASTEELMNAKQLLDLFPSWQKSFRLISSKMIRNMATVGGNIVNASPIGDISIILLALNAILEIKSGDKTRQVDLDNFYKGYKQFDLQKGEIITQVILPKPTMDSKFNFEKVSKRQHLDIANVNTAILITEKNNKIINCRVSAGGIGPIPTYIKSASDYLTNKELTPATISKAANIAVNQVKPISDVRGSADYKLSLLRRLFIAHFTVLYPEIDLTNIVNRSLS